MYTSPCARISEQNEYIRGHAQGHIQAHAWGFQTKWVAARLYIGPYMGLYMWPYAGRMRASTGLYAGICMQNEHIYTRSRAGPHMGPYTGCARASTQARMLEFPCKMNTHEVIYRSALGLCTGPSWGV